MKVVPSRQVWGGSPAKFIRDVTDEEASNIKASAEFYSTLGQRHYEEVSKTEAEREKERIQEDIHPSNPYPEEQVETIPANTKISQKNQ